MKKQFIQKIIILLLCIAFFTTLITIIVVLNRKNSIKVSDPNTKDVRVKKQEAKNNFKMSLKDIYQL